MPSFRVWLRSLLLCCLCIGCGDSSTSPNDALPEGQSTGQTRETAPAPNDADTAKTEREKKTAIANREVFRACEMAIEYLDADRPEFAEQILRNVLTDQYATERAEAEKLLDMALVAQGKPAEHAVAVADAGGRPNANPDLVAGPGPMRDANGVGAHLFPPDDNDAPPTDTTPDNNIAVVPDPAPTVKPLAVPLDPFEVPPAPEQVSILGTTEVSDTEVAKVLKANRDAESAAAGKRMLTLLKQSHSLTERQADLLTERIAEWDARIEAGVVRSGLEWVTPEQRKANQKTAAEKITEARELLRQGHFDESRTALLEASKADPGGTTADFLIGLLNCVKPFNHPPSARKHFKQVLARDPDHLGALNNLALTELKLGNDGEAFYLWEDASHLTAHNEQVNQNLGRLIAVGQRGVRPVERRLVDDLRNTYNDVVTIRRGPATDQSDGWLYTPLLASPQAAPSGGGIIIRSGAGVVIGSGHVLTTREALGLFGDEPVLPRLSILDPTDPDGKRRLFATPVTVEAEHGVVLLSVPTLDAPPAVLAPSWPTPESSLTIPVRAPNVAALNATQVQPVELVGLPHADWGHHLLFRSEQPADAGRPLLNARGEIVGLSTGRGAVLGTDLPSEAVPLLSVWSALEPHLSGVRPGVSASESAGGLTPIDQSLVTVLVERGVDTFQMAGQSGVARVIEEKSCACCWGNGNVGCPNKGCTRGRISVKTPYTQTFRSGQEVKTITKYRFVKQTCPTCKGRNQVDCRHCTGGQDPLLAP